MPLFGRRKERIEEVPFVQTALGWQPLQEAINANWLGLAATALAVDETWSGWEVAPGAAIFGLALAFAAAPLTHAAVTSVSSPRAGLASAVNHAVVRTAGLAATIGLGAVATGGTPEFSPPRLRAALFITAAIVGLGGLGLAGLFKDHEAGGVPAGEHNGSSGGGPP